MKTTGGSASLTTARACLLVCVLWAGIYLPALGSTQLKREEPRRALPALHMLKTGDWLVPHVGADAYLRKPPLLNWLIALCFRAEGGQSELAARLPSVLAMLGLSLTVVIKGRRWLGPSGSLLAAIFVLTNFAAMDIGRLAELEALYLSCTGVALIIWLTEWRELVHPWRLWCMPAPFLALGMLTKGPAHLLIFYGVVVAVLVVGKDLRILWHPAHLVAIIITLGPFLAWAIPCASTVAALGQTKGSHGAWGFWWREVSSRAAMPETAHFPLADWLLRVPQGFANFMPWTVLLPLLWSPAALVHIAKAGAREAALFRGMRWGMVTTFLVMSLLPGGSARYVYPLIVVPAVLLARSLSIRVNGDDSLSPAWLPDVWRRVHIILFVVIAGAAIVMPFLLAPGLNPSATIMEATGIFFLALTIGRWRIGSEHRVLPLAIKSAAGMILITAVYALAVVPQLNRPRPQHSREIAASIHRGMQAGKTLGVLDDQYHAFWYYLEPNVVYFHQLADLPSADQVEYFLVPAGLTNLFIEGAARQGIPLDQVLNVVDGEHHAFVLLTRPTVLPHSLHG